MDLRISGRKIIANVQGTRIKPFKVTVVIPEATFSLSRNLPGFSENAQFYTKQTLTRVHTLNSHRKKVLRDTDSAVSQKDFS